MKTYNVTIVPYIFEAPEYSDEIYELLSPSFFPSFIVEEQGLKLSKLKVDVEANNIEEALSKLRSSIKIDVMEKKSRSINMICYRVFFSYFYGRSLRDKSFDVWLSRSVRKRFLLRNRSYLTEEQIDFTCSSDITSFDRYLSNE